jgi:dihydroneopterin triphosphate diphosphatase
MTEIKIRVIDCHIAYYNKRKSFWEFLLLKRSKDTAYAETWQGVTGKIENSELPYQTALRELIEETGLNAEKLWTIDKVNTFYEAKKDIMNLIPVFGVTVNSKNVILSREHSEYKWCDINETVKLITWDQQKKGVKIFYDMLYENKNRLKFMEIKI